MFDSNGREAEVSLVTADAYTLKYKDNANPPFDFVCKADFSGRFTVRNNTDRPISGFGRLEDKIY